MNNIFIYENTKTKVINNRKGYNEKKHELFSENVVRFEKWRYII